MLVEEVRDREEMGTSRRAVLICGWNLIEQFPVPLIDLRIAWFP